jgi:hypothetical protein
VNVLWAERTLLEKLSAVHPIASDVGRLASAPAGWGRHFYDVRQLLQSEDIRAKLTEMGPDGVVRLVLDIEEQTAASGFATAPRPSNDFASSTAFNAGSAAAEIWGLQLLLY